jgi:hypothetical protein
MRVRAVGIVVVVVVVVVVVMSIAADMRTTASAGTWRRTCRSALVGILGCVYRWGGSEDILCLQNFLESAIWPHWRVVKVVARDKSGKMAILRLHKANLAKRAFHAVSLGQIIRKSRSLQGKIAFFARAPVLSKVGTCRLNTHWGGGEKKEKVG